jgi:hypothetical protein
MTKLILQSIPEDAKIIRIHVSGDFFSQAYFDAWVSVAVAEPYKIFYAYTKSLPYWEKRIGKLPANFRLTASFGGRRDDLIHELNLKSATVVLRQDDADNMGLDVDHDDTHAQDNAVPSFALLIHGAQKTGSDQSKASYANRKVYQ